MEKKIEKYAKMAKKLFPEATDSERMGFVRDLISTETFAPQAGAIVATGTVSA